MPPAVSLRSLILKLRPTFRFSCAATKASADRLAQVRQACSAACGSAPERAACQLCALAQRLELGPGDLRMDAAAQAAIRAGDDALAPDRLRIGDDPVGDQLGMLDHIGRMTDDAGDQQLAVRKPRLAPDLPFVLMADIACLDR